ncbi:MAG TPA: putative toxin-antitoxin system toxin component, PIN family [Candidatus Nanoarchaeia archaeon]|nr:putative toxin-antitoxin system toxin component, PIN family [Candidatus Nanoarchaeia archaeon]
MRVTLDTNIVVSGMFWRGVSSKILDLVMQKKIIAVASPEIVKEYIDIVTSDEIIAKTDELQQARLEAFHTLISCMETIEPHDTQRIVPDDEDDDKFLHCAHEGHCDYVITQDKHLLRIKQYENIKIATPQEVLDKITSTTE